MNTSFSDVDDFQFQLEPNAVTSANDTIVRVLHGTSAGDFLPFTSLPKRYHGKNVALVIVELPANQRDGYAGTEIG